MNHDDQGRMLELRTFSNLTAEPTATTTGYAKTTWQYSTTTGHLLSKKDHAEKGASYTYTPAGRLKTRTWARSTAASPQVTTYSYTHGMMTATDYSDTTPDVTITYDLLGRQKTLSNGIATSTFDYHTNHLDLDKETITYTLPGQSPFTRTIDRSQDAIQRSTGYQLNNGTTTEQAVTYRYNSASGRLGAVSAQTIGSSATQDFLYGYENQSNLIKTTQSFTNYNFSTNTGTGIHQVTNTYEAHRNVLLTKANTRANDESTISSIGYTVNNLGQRTSATRSGAATNSTAWGYDALGQVISADDTNNTADRAYQYDTIGNRKKSAESLTLPDDNNYTTNPLNQYTNIGGTGGYNPTFDEDGNQRNAQIHPTGSSTPLAALYEWDGENRLRSVKNSTGVILVEYHYDAQSRRIATIGRGDLPSLSSPEQTTLHLYDGWNCIAEYTTLDLQTFDLRHSYLWGPDLSGSMQGAGGVGGLLAVTRTPVTGAPVTYYPCFDGNGNITEYINASGAIVAHFEYDPFGNTPIITGAQAQEFKYRFSTKPLENTTGLYYYGYRYYTPQTGRWINRDPIEENGGLNLYNFLKNQAVTLLDLLGLQDYYVGDNGRGNFPRLDEEFIPPNLNKPSPKNNQIYQKRKWRHTINDLYISWDCCKCNTQKVQQIISDQYLRFGPYNNNNPDVLGRIEGNNAIFQLRGFAGVLQAIMTLGEFSVTLNGGGIGYNQEAITNEWHPLIGMRRWGANLVEPCGKSGFGEMRLWTEAYEVKNNLASLDILDIGYAAADRSWNNYLNEIALVVQNQCGGKPELHGATKRTEETTAEILIPWLD